MKKIFAFMVVLLPLMAIMSCSGDDDNGEEAVSLAGTKWESDGARTYYSYDFCFTAAYDIDFISETSCVLKTYEHKYDVVNESLISVSDYTTIYNYIQEGKNVTLTPISIYSSPTLKCVISGDKMEATDVSTGDAFCTFILKEKTE